MEAALRLFDSDKNTDFYFVAPSNKNNKTDQDFLNYLRGLGVTIVQMEQNSDTLNLNYRFLDADKIRKEGRFLPPLDENQGDEWMMVLVYRILRSPGPCFISPDPDSPLTCREAYREYERGNLYNREIYYIRKSDHKQFILKKDEK